MKNLSLFWRIVHGIIIINFALQIFYGSVMVFIILAPDTMGPLWDAAKKMPFEQMMVRRQYALETWMAIVGLALYLAITEILPRILKIQSERNKGDEV